MALLCQDCLGSSKILSGFFLAVSLKTEAALNRHLDLGRINTVATLQSPSKLLSVCVGPIMWSSACSPQAARLRASTHTPCRHSELTDACPNRLTAGTRCGGCGRALRQGWLCRAGQSSGWGHGEAACAPPRPRAVRPARASEGLRCPGPGQPKSLFHFRGQVQCFSSDLERQKLGRLSSMGPFVSGSPVLF